MEERWLVVIGKAHTCDEKELIAHET